MIDTNLLTATASVSGLAIVSLAALRGWNGWLQLKERELEQNRPDIEGGASSGMARIEMADLKERIRKLEAIAAGVDL
ncbi:hypothetical protein [Novosphingobium sp. TH158]|uniref:hypothetical protein n=1 Tax=Novosphingobium sp. TH158 TaxID=2067455 RepID=UPI00156E7311|nr:hypothetical protein [Novosphingobium sp. TH158]